jgi:hypothetical protein
MVLFLKQGSFLQSLVEKDKKEEEKRGGEREEKRGRGGEGRKEGGKGGRKGNIF